MKILHGMDCPKTAGLLRKNFAGPANYSMCKASQCKHFKSQGREQDTFESFIECSYDPALEKPGHKILDNMCPMDPSNHIMDSKTCERCPSFMNRGITDMGAYFVLCNYERPKLPTIEITPRIIVPIDPKEKEVLDHLIAAFNEFGKLESYHQDHIRDFTDAIQQCQRIIAVRHAMRTTDEFVRK